jgi:ribosome assembly protein SQT1
MTVLTGHTLTSTAGAWPSSGKTLLTTSSDSTLIQWDPRSSAPLFKSSIFCPPGSDTLDPEIHGITTLAVAPNGQIAALGSSNGLVKTVNLADGKVVGRLTGHEEGESIEALVFVDVLGGQGGGKGVVLVSGGTRISTSSLPDLQTRPSKHGTSGPELLLPNIKDIRE